MLAQALVLTLATELVLVVMLLGRIRPYLKPYRSLVLEYHGWDLAVLCALLAFNLLALYSVLLNRFHLTGVGDKLPLSQQDIEAEG